MNTNLKVGLDRATVLKKYAVGIGRAAFAFLYCGLKNLIALNQVYQ